MSQARELTSQCNVYRGTAPPPAPPVLPLVECCLQQARTTFQYSATTLSPSVYRYIYLPRRTDVRCNPDGTGGDLIRLPAGGTTIYRVIDVQDMQRDTPQEQRRVLVIWDQQDTFPIP